MAFVKREGGRFAVRQGNTGALLSTHATRKEATDRVAALHREHKPKSGNRGKTAAKMFRGQKLSKTQVGAIQARNKKKRGGRSKSGRRHK